MFQLSMLLNLYSISFIISNIDYLNTYREKNKINMNIIYDFNIIKNINNINNNLQQRIKKKINSVNIQNIKNINFDNIDERIKTFNFEPSLIINQKIDVYIHIEKLYARIPIYHIGVSYFNGYKTVRYDYRPFNENGSYITNHTRNNETFKNNIIISKTIYWCQIDYPLEYIDLCEQEIVKQYPKYRLGINDCRHYANRLTLKTTNKPTPIWKLYRLWNSI